MLNSDFRDILSIFNARRVDYLLVGAYALAVHGLPRATGDIDILIQSDSRNAQRAFDALGEFGAPMDSLTANDLTTAGILFQIGVAPRRIDVLTSIDGVEFTEAWQRRQIVEIEGLTIPVLSRKDLITNKRTVGRPQDVADVAWLESHESEC